jgi:predicted 3-demethylubiquinone-9 3-methyltransferase (glyoxalase superfamily)
MVNNNQLMTNTMVHQIYPCLWFDGNAKEAADFYCTVFNEASILEDQGMVVRWKIYDNIFMGLNGGPHYKINPSISFFVGCKSEDEINAIWGKLMEGGFAMMALDKYPWSEKYGWCQDKFGVSWQLTLGHAGDGRDRIVPSILLTQSLCGKAQDAINYYSSIFPKSEILAISRYEEGEGDLIGNIKYASFIINGQPLIMMESSGSHQFALNEGISLVIACDNQEEIDYYWNKFAKDGEESRCGWCKDKYGLSWQIVPSNINELMIHPENGQKSMQALMKMKKIIIADLL